MAATNRVPTERPSRSAMMTSMMLGGISIPSVPEAAMVPVASSRLYSRSTMTGSAIRLIITTEAPMMPVVAARIVPMTVTASASPPGVRRSTTWRQYSRLEATPERSSIVPMKMNIGIATSTRLSAKPQMRSTRLKNSTWEKTSKYMPMKPKARPTPPSTNPTGKPENRRIARVMNMQAGR